MTDTPEGAPPQDTSSEAELIKNRYNNLHQISLLVKELYPFNFLIDATAFQINEKYGSKTSEDLDKEPAEVSTAGRILAQRIQGKAGFLDLSDGRQRIQIYVRKDDVGEPTWTLFKALDLGDWIGVKGGVFRTRTGQLSVKAQSLVFLAKCLRPLPEKWHGLKDIEQRYRQRYLDLAVNPESRHVFETRASMIRSIRRFLDERGYVEVETPMMQPIAGGALARPFVTHHNALDLQLYLRIAPELYLKRLVVGGLERVYEINRNFRNEGISTQHNPEFTMLEFYQAYSRASDLMTLTEEMFAGLVREVRGGTTTPWGDQVIDWAPPFQKVTMRQAVLDATREDPRGAVQPEELETAQGLLKAASRFGVKDPGRFAGKKGKLLAELFEAVAEARFIQPTFLTEFPTEISPLSKQNAEGSEWVDRFELYAGGMEIANGFSELNDPLEQEQRFRDQAKERATGDAEAMPFDSDYIDALKYGMPPAAGEGVGIDRLTMLLTDSHSIRDVILFPSFGPSLSFESFVALRYLAASRKRAHVALIAAISTAGLAIGVAALVISLALLSGFQDRIRLQMAERTPHLRVSAVRGVGLLDAAAVRAALGALPGVVEVSPEIEGRGWLSDEKGLTAAPVRYRNGKQRPPEPDGVPGALLLGPVAGRTGARAGSLVRLTSSRMRLSPIGPVPVAVVLRVEDVRRTSALDRSPDVELPESTARILAGMPSGAPAYTARLASADSAEAAARTAGAALGPGYRVQTWRELNAALAFALRLEKLVIFATVALVILVAALNIVSNIALLVVEKKRDLGVFATLGAAPASLSRVYLLLGLFIGGLGTAGGLAAGAAISWLLDRYKLVPLPADVYLLSSVPFTIHPAELGIVAIFALATALGASVLPARAAARLAPGEAIRLSR